MKNRQILLSIIAYSAIFMLSSCAEKNTATDPEQDKVAMEKVEKDFTLVLEKHLKAVADRDMATLKSTMSPEGKMQLILPDLEIINSSDGFMSFHEEWFQDTTWAFETKILNSDVTDKLGIATVQSIYSEPERDGVPYFNRMNISYVLERIDNQWYIIKDHASSIEKSTD